jgi:hypothetical protein
MHASRHPHPAGLIGLVLLLAVLSIVAQTPALAQTGLQFNGSSQQVTFGTAAGLNASNFTLECWFMRTGTGVTTTTGTGGLANAIPLVTKGRGEGETPANLNMNYFLGIRSDNVLAADFEEGSGPNHPIAGVTPIQLNFWYHAAVTYQASTGRYRLYLNGVSEKDTSLTAGITPASTSIQHAALATAMTSTGAAAGYFAGLLDEARIWNRAKTQQAIQDSMLLEVTSGGGLLGRWGLNEGTGTIAGNSVGGGVNGTLTNSPAWVAGSPFALSSALRLGSANARVAFGNPAALGLPQFTLECWFRRDGSGTATSTGTGGVNALPLITKGRAQADGDVRDMNYFLGIDGSDSVLVADFEEGATGSTPGLNHPVFGFTPVARGVWHHAAATYDGTAWRLYLDGELDAVSTVGQPPRWDSAQRAGLGTAYDSSGTAAGYFNGTLDEARIWNYARSEAGLDSTINLALGTATTGLVARWGLDEGAGSTVNGSAGTTVTGTITGSGWSWTGPAPFDAAPQPALPPAAPTDLTATAVSIGQVHLAWTDASLDERQFEVERSTSGVGGPYAPLVTLPANTISYDDGDVLPNAPYCYRVQAANLAGSSGWGPPACATTPIETNRALAFDGTDAYVTFGDPPALHLRTFTIECWFRRDAHAPATSTGTGGIPDAVPLLTKGRHEEDGDARDMNFFLGLRDSDDVIAADFEEGSDGPTPGLNHPVFGVTPVSLGVWHHAAATYDGSTWRLYFDGNLEAELAVGAPPRWDSAQHAGLATAMDTSGTAEGFFQGAIDEARVWDYARTQAQIDDALNLPLLDPVEGLVARWGLNEGIGTLAQGSAGTSVDGVVTGTGWNWTEGAPFNLSVNHSPEIPALVRPAHLATDVPREASLAVSAGDPDADPLTVRFYGRPSGPGTGADFSIIVLPDAQFYSAGLNGGTPAMFRAQTDWIVAHRESLNVAFVVQEGDIVNNADVLSQWDNAANAMYALEDTARTHLPDGIPYGVTVGNHDQWPYATAAPDTTTKSYNLRFGAAHFAGRSYHGGHYGTNNDSHFELFSASGLDFLCISLEYGTTTDVSVLDWADSLLKAYPARQGIIVHHNLIGTGEQAAWQNGGQTLYDALKDNPNLDLMLCGHAAGEGKRMDVFQGDTVHTILADYQARTHGGDGWLRVLEFSPATNQLRVKTYSPTLDSFETDGDSHFTLNYVMGAPFELIGTLEDVAPGSTAAVLWTDLAATTEYEWYATASDAIGTTAGPHWRFTTGSGTSAVDDVLPGRLTFGPAQPNPFVSGTVFAFALPSAGSVRLSIYDVRGRRVATPVDGLRAAGHHTLRWEGRDAAGARLSPGAYFARLEFAGQHEVRKLVLLK